MYLYLKYFVLNRIRVEGIILNIFVFSKLYIGNSVKI